jgi:hypothetical protein
MVEVYGSTPIYKEVSDMIEFFWQREFKESYRSMRTKWFLDDQDALAKHLASGNLPEGVKAGDLTAIELEVLNNPDTIHYKYSELDVRPSVLELITTGVPVEEVAPYVQSVAGRNANLT